MSGPHVWVEVRAVYVSARGGRLTERAAYNAAANHLIKSECDCCRDECDARPGCQCQWTDCRFHADDGEHLGKVKPRLVRYLRFLDSVNAVVRG